MLAVPVAAMGATFPIGAAWLTSTTAKSMEAAPRHAAAAAGVLYAANTAGATLGATSAGFWLIPALGLRGTTLIGVGLSGIAALGVLWLAREEARTAGEARLADPIPSRSSKRPASRSSHAQKVWAAPRPALACTAAALSGCSALVYEVAFTRLLVAGDRPDHVRVCDDRGFVHRRDRARIGRWRAPGPAGRAAGALARRDAGDDRGERVADRGVCGIAAAARRRRSGRRTRCDVSIGGRCVRRLASRCSCCR